MGLTWEEIVNNAALFVLILRYRLGCVNVAMVNLSVKGEGCLSQMISRDSRPQICAAISFSGLLSHGSHFSATCTCPNVRSVAHALTNMIASRSASRSSLPSHAQQLGILSCRQPLTEVIDMTEQLEYTHH